MNTILTHVDLAPTLLALCGLNPTGDMQGTDLSQVILGKSRREPDSAYFQIFVSGNVDGTPHPWRGVRTKRYMYARSESAPWVLYDLENDPYELKNLANDPQASGIRAAMEKKLVQWMKRTRDSWSYDIKEHVEDGGRLYRFRTFYTIDEYLKWAKEHPELLPKK